MNSAPVSIKMLLMPLNTAVATKARRHALSAAASSELAGCCCAGARAEFIKTAYHCLRTQHYARPAIVRRSAILARRGAICHIGDDNGPNIPALHQIWAGSRPLVN